MTSATKHIIIAKAKMLFATQGYEGFSMRVLAKHCNINLSSIYHFFPDKDQLLHEVFKQVSKELGIKRALLPKRKRAEAMLKDRILFQFQNIEDIVFVLKYYLHFRDKFERIEHGYIPAKAYLHVDEVLVKGNETGEFSIPSYELVAEAKVIAHAINGFLLEYYPTEPKRAELQALVRYLHRFIMRSLRNQEVPM